MSLTNHSQRVGELSPLKRALVAIDELQSRVDALQREKREPIAVVGMGCRFPGGAVDAESFWRLLENGVDTVTEIPAGRWPVDRYYDADPEVPGKMYTRHGAFLSRVDGFDAEFFGIAPREAISMDPQHRLLLEVCWEALENAVCAPDKLAGSRTGVYIGISASDYAQRAMPSDSYDQLNPYSGTGCALSIAAGRLSYLLGLQGPSLALDTACSSSLVALHLACQSLRLRECDLALAGGVNLMLSPGPAIYLSKVRALSFDGRCKTFDAAADGYVRGEGCGIVVLKRLSDALAARDPILAVIRGSAVNQDGRSSGLTAPNGPSQEAILREALAQAGVAPSDIGYIETHGTGTPLGDPIELRALGAVLGSRDPVAIGSVKTNIGHLEAAAGIAGFIKTVLVLQRRAIPPHLHFKTPNPYVAWSELPLFVPTARTPWDAPRRIAGVSSFGLSGTNAHVIVEEAPLQSETASAAERPLHILTLSARSAPALQELTATFGEIAHDSFADICYTANTGRAHMPHRIAIVAGNMAGARAQLASAFPRGVERKTPPTILFKFPATPHDDAIVGELSRTQPEFRAALERHAGNPLAAQLAYAELLRAWGIEPSYVTGEGRGEVAAAVVAEAFTAEEGKALLNGGAGISRRAPRIGMLADADLTVTVQPVAWPVLLVQLAELYLAGVEIDWAAFDRPFPRRKLPLPTYPFQRERYWLEAPLPRGASETGASFPGRRLSSPALKDTVYESRFDQQGSYTFLADHQVYGAVVVAGACWVSATLSAARHAGPGPITLRDVVFPEALILEPAAAHRVQIILAEPSFQVVSCPENLDSWTVHASGKISAGETASTAPDALDEIRQHCKDEIQAADFYQKAREADLQLGPQFQWIEHVWRRGGEALGRMRMPRPNDDADVYQLHPGLIDSCFQLVGASAQVADTAPTAYAPIGVDQFRFYERPSGSALWCHVILRQGKEHRADIFKADLRLLEDSGRMVAAAEGVLIQRAPREAFLGRAAARLGDWLYEIDWQPSPRSSWRPVPEYVTPPAQIARSLDARVAEVESAPPLHVYEKLAPELDRLSTAYARQAFVKLFGERVQAASLAERLRAGGIPGRLLQLILSILEDERILHRNGSGWEIRAAENEPSSNALYAGLIKAFPECEAELSLLAQCGDHLHGVITGEEDPLQVLFPGGSAAAVEKLYRTSPAARAVNTLAAEAVQKALEGLPAGRLVRILEIGAGTGGTAASVLPALTAESTEYLFTDVSPLLVSKAQETFRAFPFVRYRALDIEKAPAAQGFDAHGFDLIVAANVLHATSSLRETLQHVRQLLAPSGLLLLVENTGRQRWLDLIFGLTDGWWKFNDHDIRPSHPLVNRRAWLSLLAETGYRDAVAIPGEAEGHDSPQTILIAQTPLMATEETGWLVFADQAGVAASLSRSFAGYGQPCVTVIPGSSFERRGAAEFALDPTRPEHFARLLEESSVAGYRGVIHCWSLDTPDADSQTGASVDSAQLLGCASAMHLVQSLSRRKGAGPVALWLVTRGAQPAGPDGGLLSPAQAPLWGLGKVIALEHPELRCVRVDLDPAAELEGNAKQLAEEIWTRDGEDAVAFRGGQRHAPRLTRSTTGERLAGGQLKLPASEYFQLQISKRGMLDNLVLQPAARRGAARGQIEIQVAATGLNFRDVLNAMGMYPGDAGPMGLECAGTVAAIGEGVTGFAVGDEVLAVAPGSFSRFVTTYASFVVPKPPAMTFAEAATIPITFLTAYYSLHHLAHIAAGDRVLIHAAAGGVGLAAVQLAQLAGAEVFATAGSPEKQAFLRSLGVSHIASSRTLDFAREFAGVNVVLNSLTGEFIAKSLAILQPHGRFVEIGKTGIWTPAQVSALGKDIGYFVYDLARQCQEEPEFVGAMLRELIALFREGKLRPLPLHTFEMGDIVGAFRFMQQARHLGKIVITQQTAPPAAPAATFLPDATYLITGGTRGLGLLTAEWMIGHGARHLVLTGRSDPTPAAAAALDRLRQRTGILRIERADAASREQMARVLDSIAASLPPLRGIVHSAGMLDDGVILEQNWDRFAAVMAPKVSGSWNLHALTRDLPLDFFVLYSSIVSVIGSPGQSNHAAANSFLDALAHYRRAYGLPALSINWGAWSETGAAARGNVGARVRMQGMAEISPPDGIRVLEKIWHSPSAQIGVLPVDWNGFFRRNPAAAESRFLTVLTREARSRATVEVSSAARTDLLRRLESARPSERLDVLLSCVQTEAAKVLGLDASRTLDPRRPLNEIGLDSLMAVELRNALGLLAGRTLPVTLLFDYPTLQGLTEYLAAEAFPAAAAPVRAESPSPIPVAAPATELSGDELLSSFDRELASLDQWMEP